LPVASCQLPVAEDALSRGLHRDLFSASSTISSCASSSNAVLTSSAPLQDAQSHASNSGDWPALHLSVHGHMHAQEDVIIWQGRQGTRGLVQAPNNFCLNG